MDKKTDNQTLTVLRETVKPNRTNTAIGVSPTGVRLVSLASQFGFGQRRPLTLSEVIQISAVLICLDVLSQDISKAGLKMYERLPNNGKRELEPGEHWFADMLREDPNAFHTWYEFLEMEVLHLGIIQNAFIAKRLKPGSNEVEEFIPCMPARCTILAVTPENDTSGRGFFVLRVDRFSDQERIFFSGMPEILLPHEFIHMRGRMFDGLMGYSTLEAGAATFRLSKELQEYQTRLFANDGQLRGVFSKPGENGETLSDPAFERLRDQLAELMSNFRRENRPIVLEEGMTFEHIAMNADQAEVAKARDAAVVDNARLFRIPPHKIMHLINVKYENMETLEKSYVQDSLIPICRRIEPRLERSILTAKERQRYMLQFDRKQMLLNDMEKLSEVMKIMIQNSALEVDEMRSGLGWNELPNDAGKIRLAPSTYNVIGRKNEVVIPAGAQPAGGDEEKPSAKKPKPKPKDVDDPEGEIIQFPTLVGEK